jgi:O-antigen/teichoic acid export membrane protein
LSIAILFAQRLSLAAADAFQAVEDMAMAAVLTALPYVVRLLALGVATHCPGRLTTESWGIWYLASAVLTAGIAFAVVSRSMGMPKFDLGLIRSTTRQGADFSMGIATDALYSDLDKAMMARLSTLEATGIYAAAYRAVDAAFMPVQAILYAVYPRFFVHGGGGVRRGLAFARSVMPYTIGLGIAASVCLWSFAFLVPVLLGPGYGETAGAIRVLAPLPSIQALYFLAGDTLTGAGFQRMRSVAQAGIVALNIGLNLWLIPEYSWRGAAWATLISEGLLTALLWLAVWHLTSRDEEGATG